MNIFKGLHRDKRGGAAIEMLLVLPYQILFILLTIQMAHLFVAHQVVQYAAFAAARTAMVSDVAGTGSEVKWPSGGGDATEQKKAIQAAAQACSMLEYQSFQVGNFQWVNLPNKFNPYTNVHAQSLRPRFRRTQNESHLELHIRMPQTENGDVWAAVSYETFLPVPMANRLVYKAMQAAGKASSSDLRINIAETCVVARPWK